MIQKSRATFIILSIIAACAIAGYIIFLMKIRSKAQEISISAAKLQEQQIYAQDNAALETLLNNTKSDIDSVSTHFVSPDGTVLFINFVEAMAKSKGLSITVNSINAADAPIGGFSWMNISISTTGTWSATNEFLKSLETMPYKISVGNVVLNQGSPIAQAAKGKATSTTQVLWAGSFAFSVLQQK